LNNKHNILSPELQNYSVEPPAFLFESVMDKIRRDENALDAKLQALSAHAIAPNFSFETIMGKITATDTLNNFKPLKNYEVAPPYSFTKIMEVIKAALGITENTTNKTLAPVISLPIVKRIMAAAAVLLIAALGYYTVTKFTKDAEPGSDPSIAVNPAAPIAPNPVAPTGGGDTTNNLLPTNANPLNKNYGGELASGSRAYGKSFGKLGKRKGSNGLLDDVSGPIVDSVENFSIAGMKTPMVDNDFLATFASFNESALPPFLQSETPISTVISVDQFTDIVVTDKMGAFMKKMYKTRKSGKPTRKARKAKQKLEKWKVADSTYFSNETLNNPLNPVDLGNFILKK
jgi:hypothetical protein